MRGSRLEVEKVGLLWLLGRNDVALLLEAWVYRGWGGEGLWRVRLLGLRRIGSSLLGRVALLLVVGRRLRRVGLLGRIGSGGVGRYGVGRVGLLLVGRGLRGIGLAGVRNRGRVLSVGVDWGGNCPGVADSGGGSNTELDFDPPGSLVSAVMMVVGMAMVVMVLVGSGRLHHESPLHVARGILSVDGGNHLTKLGNGFHALAVIDDGGANHEDEEAAEDGQREGWGLVFDANHSGDDEHREEKSNG